MTRQKSDSTALSTFFDPVTPSRSRFYELRILKAGSILFLILILGLAVSGPRTAHALSSPSPSCATIGDFDLFVDPSHLVILPGATGTSHITVSPKNGFTGIVSLETKNVPLGFTTSLSSISLDLSTGSQTSTLTVTPSSTTITGIDYTFVLNATTSGTVYHQETISVKVPGPELGIQSESFFLTVSNSGPPVTDMIDVQALYGLADPSADLSATIAFPPPGSTPPALAISSPVSVSTSVTTATLTVTATSSTTPDEYVVTVSGSSVPGNVMNSTYVFIRVTGPGIGLNADPFQISISPGASKDSTITVSSLGGFTSSSVSLSATSVPPLSGYPTGTLSPSSVAVTPGSPSTSVLTVTTPPTIISGTYLLEIVATSGSTSNTTFVDVTVPGTGFSMSASPTSVSVATGGSSSSTATINLGSELGFSGTVGLTIICVPDGLNASISPSSVPLTGSGSTGSATLTVSTYSFTTPGNYLIFVSGVSISPYAQNETIVPVTVTGSDFTIAASSTTLSISAGGSAHVTITAASVSGFSGTVDLTTGVLAISGPSTGLTSSVSPSSLVLAGNSKTSMLTLTASAAGTYYVTVSGKSGSLIHQAALYVTVTAPAPDFGISVSASTLSIVQGGSDSSTTVNVVSIGGFANDVSLTSSVSPAGPTVSFGSATVSGGSGSSTITVTVGAAVSPGPYSVTITGTSGSLTHSAIIMVTVTAAPDFSISLAPSSLSIAKGSSGASSLAVGPLNGFTNTVLLSKSGNPAGVSVVLGPASISGGGSSTITVNISGLVPAGTYYVTITGTSGLLTHSTILTITVTAASDFGASLNKDSLSIKQGSSDTSTITISPSGGFTGTVQLSASVYPSGPTVSFSPSSVPSGSGSSTMTVNVGNSVPTGTYDVTITETSGGLSHTKSMSVTVTQASTQPTAQAPANLIFGLDQTTFYALVGGLVALVLIGGILAALRMRKPKSLHSNTNS